LDALVGVAIGGMERDSESWKLQLMNIQYPKRAPHTADTREEHRFECGVMVSVSLLCDSRADGLLVSLVVLLLYEGGLEGIGLDFT
jgi:hypothetical protein